MPLTSPFDRLITTLPLSDPQYATQVVDGLLQMAMEVGASDLHLQPIQSGLFIKWRIDGVLLSLGVIDLRVASNIVIRLKVLAKLLTYETHLPQEGRIAQSEQMLDIRISTFPTIFGEKVVARFLRTGELSQALVGDLSFPIPIQKNILSTLSRTSGALLIVGPAGSGKTTTAYACLREITNQSDSQRNITSIEDPVEGVLAGITQSEVSEAAGFHLNLGLRSLVRQDPDVIFIGEIRDPETANLAFQAALTGQLVITTFHASDSTTALNRLADMGVPDYILRSAIHTVVAQQLVRRLCNCASNTSLSKLNSNSKLGLPIDACYQPQGCSNCQQTGYQGRQLVAEVLNLDSHLVGSAIQAGVDANTLRSLATEQGLKTLYDHAIELVKNGKTSPAEILRVLGVR